LKASRLVEDHLERFRRFEKHFGVSVVFWNLFSILLYEHWRFWTAFKAYETF